MKEEEFKEPGTSYSIDVSTESDKIGIKLTWEEYGVSGDGWYQWSNEEEKTIILSKEDAIRFARKILYLANQQ